MHMRLCLPIIALAATLTACDKNPNASTQRNLCRIGKMCDIELPSPLKMYVDKAAPVSGAVLDAIGKGEPKAGFVRQLVAYGPDEAYRADTAQYPDGPKFLVTRLYFVTSRKDASTGDIWAVPGRKIGQPPRPQRVVEGANLWLSDVVTDGASHGIVGLFRFALIDKRTGRGPTFLRDPKLGTYSRLEFDSAQMRREWEASVTSSCGGGPLTKVPEEWWKDRERDCEELRHSSANEATQRR